MNAIRQFLRRTVRTANGIELTFGLREAVILATVGMAIGIAAAVHYAN